MKGVVLAGGMGTRLFPLTKVTNKHLLPVGLEPMIFHPIKKILGAGIREILIVTGPEHMGHVVQLLGSGRHFDAQFTYRVQDEAGGIAQALALAEAFVGEDKVVVVLGDNIFEDALNEAVEDFRCQKTGAKILLKAVDDPQRYGVVELADGEVVGIEEKPSNPKSNLAVVGIYMYDRQVFDIIRTLKPSARGEYEITDVNNAYLQMRNLTHAILHGWWTDAGTFESIKSADHLWRSTWGNDPARIPERF